MAKISYELTCKAKHVEIVDGIAIITFERDVDIDEVSNAEASGEYQSTMLWECFDHSFEACTDHGNVINYDDEGEMI